MTNTNDFSTIFLLLGVSMIASLYGRTKLNILKFQSKNLILALGDMGFTKSSTPLNFFEYTLMERTALRGVATYTSEAPTLFTLSSVNIEVRLPGQKKRFDLYPFLLFTFNMREPHPDVLLCDVRHAVQGEKSLQRILESNEFQKAFNIYATDPKAPFYFLDPDTMADLIDIQKKSPYSLFIESAGNSLLIGVALGKVHDQFIENLTFREKVTGRIHTKNSEAYQKYLEELPQLFTLAQKVFHSLDYTSQHLE